MQINKETIEQLFRQHYLRMYQLARVLLKDDAASKDVVSEVFADVLNGKTQLELDNETANDKTIASTPPLPSANAGSYLLVCVRHKCLNLLSRQKMKDRVHHLLKADTSPSIAPLEATIAEIDRETESTRQFRLIWMLNSRHKPARYSISVSAETEISGDCYGIGHQRSGSL